MMNENTGKGRIKSVTRNRKARRDKERKAWSRAAVMNGVYKGSVFEFGTASLRLGLVSRLKNTLKGKVWSITDKGRQALDEE